MVASTGATFGRFCEVSCVVNGGDAATDCGEFDTEGIELACVGFSITSGEFEFPAFTSVDAVDPFAFGAGWSAVALTAAIAGNGIGSHDGIHGSDCGDGIVYHLNGLFEGGFVELFDFVGCRGIEVAFEACCVISASGDLFDVDGHFLGASPVHGEQEQEEQSADSECEHDGDADEQAGDLFDFVGPHGGFVDVEHSL